MTVEETAKILTLIQVEYPHSFAKLDERQMALKAELWEREFKEDPVEQVYTAVRMLFESGMPYAPNIGDIRKKMQILRQPDGELTEAEAWAMVSKACRNGSYGYMEEFAKLPPEVQRAVGRPEQLKEWAAMDEDVVQSVIASNFMRSYKAVAARKKEEDLYPGALRDTISRIQLGWEGLKNALPGKEK